MKNSRLILATWCISLSLCCIIPAFGQPKLPILKASGSTLSIRIDSVLYPNAWTINLTLKPDVLDVPVQDKPVRVAFITKTDSIVRTIRTGESLDFVVLTTSGDSAFTRIRGFQFAESARFSKAYIAAHRGKTFVEIPDVYELVNIVFALTKTTQPNDDLIEKSTAYYKAVMQHFQPYKNDPIVQLLDSLLMMDKYFPLKMDAYAFTFDKAGAIRQSAVYDRVSWGNENTLRPYINYLQRFANRSGFLKFYRKQQPYYAGLVRAYQDSIGVAEMQSWLNRNFPSTRWDSFKIIFSPLVSGNQSAKSFENNGFREAQAHVNFPFPDPSDADFSKKANAVADGDIVFTELNHSFINPEAEKPQYSQKLESALGDLNAWLAEGKPAKKAYSNFYACFEEYMNWGLVSLRYVDYAPKADLPLLLRRVEKRMVERRGFKKFAEFNQFLVSLYQNRPTGATVADLYPQIIDWFNSHK